VIVTQAEDNFSHGTVVADVQQLLGHVLEDEPLDVDQPLFLRRKNRLRSRAGVDFMKPFRSKFTDNNLNGKKTINIGFHGLFCKRT
jgi:hypothetical protein